VTVGEARLDLSPMLNNPKALFNVAQRLHEIPQQVRSVLSLLMRYWGASREA
jgi:hypothetical protein